MIGLRVKAALAAVILAGGVAWHVLDLRADLKAARAELATAQAQAEANQAGAEINDIRAANVARARSKAEEGRRAVQQAPDLDRALAEYGSALDGVRAEGLRPVAPADGRRPDPGR